MYSMQYLVPLSKDFDISAIGKRVSAKAPDYDAFPGLAMKVWMAQSKTRHGGNLYGTFYLWSDAAGAARFLTGPGFQGIIDSFGRPPVTGWIALEAQATGPLDNATVAVQSFVEITEAGSVEAAVPDAKRRHAGLEPAFTAICLDPTRWRLVVFSMVPESAFEAASRLGRETRIFDVLHVSLPGGIERAMI